MIRIVFLETRTRDKFSLALVIYRILLVSNKLVLLPLLQLLFLLLPPVDPDEDHGQDGEDETSNHLRLQEAGFRL